MSSIFANRPNNKRFLLIAIMLGILMISVGLAWLLVRSGDPGRQKGSEIIAQVRRRKLPTWWSPQPLDLWYLARDSAGQVVGWERMSRIFTGNRYEGSIEMHLRSIRYRGNWRTSPGAAMGEYFGRTATVRGRVEIWIGLKDGTVSVRSDGSDLATAPVPDNYIPEGLNTLVLMLVAGGQQNAVCRMIFDTEAISGGRINFRTVRLRPVGSGRVQLNTSGGGPGRIYQFDRNGLLERIEDPADGTTFTRVPASAVIKHFPEAGRLAPAGEGVPDRLPLGEQSKQRHSDPEDPGLPEVRATWSSDRYLETGRRLRSLSASARRMSSASVCGTNSSILKCT